MNLQLRVDGLNGVCSASRLGLANVRRSEEELAIEVGALYGIHVGHMEPAVALATRHAHQGKALQKLAPNRTATHYEISEPFELVYQ